MEQAGKALEKVRTSSDTTAPDNLCRLCDNTGEVIRPWLLKKSKVNKRGLPCPRCHGSQYELALEKRIQKRLDQALSRAGVPSKFRDAVIEDFVADGRLVGGGFEAEHVRARVEWKEAVQQYIGFLSSNVAAGRGLSLHGSTGTGKTMLFCIVATEMNRRGLSTAVLDEAAIYESIQNGYKEKRADAVRSRFESVRGLFIDDLGVVRTTDWVREQFYFIIDRRYRADLPTFICTNLSREQLKTIYPREASRLIEKNVELVMVGPDIRESSFIHQSQETHDERRSQ